jgi:hypothetical protein
LINGAASVHFVQFENLTIAGTMAASAQPAITQPGGDGADAEYFLESIDPTSSFDNRIGVWALTHQEVVSKGGIPALTNVVINSEVFGVPPNAVQMGSASLLNTGDAATNKPMIGGEQFNLIGRSLEPSHPLTTRGIPSWWTKPSCDGS